MTNTTETEKTDPLDLAHEDGMSESRRRLLRAGLAAGPVLLAVKSRSVLACGGSYGGGNGVKCRITCSAFASIKAADAAGIKLSHRPTSNYPCKSHHEWKVCSHPRRYADKKNCYFHADSYKPKRFTMGWNCHNWGGDPTYAKKGSIYKPHTDCKYVGFQRKNQDHDDRTLQEMLYCDDPLARHLVATILNKEATLDTDNILPNLQQCHDIWRGNGVWTPPNCTTAWTRADTIAWFDLCYGTCS